MEHIDSAIIDFKMPADLIDLPVELDIITRELKKLENRII